MASPPSTIADEFLDAGSSIGSYMASLLQVSAFRKGDGSKWQGNRVNRSVTNTEVLNQLGTSNNNVFAT